MLRLNVNPKGDGTRVGRWTGSRSDGVRFLDGLKDSFSMEKGSFYESHLRLSEEVKSWPVFQLENTAQLGEYVLQLEKYIT